MVLAVLNLLYMFSKRSNFITRLGQEKRAGLLTRLTHLAASWGGKDNGFGLSKCCTDDPIHTFPGILDNSQTKNVLSIYLENGKYDTDLSADHRPGRLIDLEILADFKIMVARVGITNRIIRVFVVEVDSDS